MNAPPRRQLGRVEVVLVGRGGGGPPRVLERRAPSMWASAELRAFVGGFVVVGLVLVAIAVASRELAP